MLKIMPKTLLHTALVSTRSCTHSFYFINLTKQTPTVRRQCILRLGLHVDSNLNKDFFRLYFKCQFKKKLLVIFTRIPLIFIILN